MSLPIISNGPPAVMFYIIQNVRMSNQSLEHLIFGQTSPDLVIGCSGDAARSHTMQGANPKRKLWQT